ncbi:ATPase [Cryobacterium roopkundense]|uniref:ATPase n=1 Tax=Cryobacterium roopkundense TaxID=1001240 RepID=A0A099JLY6_9MICO|nr:DUF349 domain-containing protein [Cryobacterium roopkundense]KGJ79196.1 ATPase [Cryobacterium roopkundense]MBB5641389.1 uncharacterized small protein (DUF1192 family) [Cryobacterium roopkundense]
MTTTDQQPWGRVDETGTVYVREASGERAVGQYPDATPEEALAYFERKYVELNGQVTLLEQRAKGGAPAADVAKSVANLTTAVATANAVGNLAALAERLSALGGAVTELTEQQGVETKAAAAAAVAERAAIVDEAERLAAEDPAKTQWKQTSAALDALFAKWQAHQHDAPRIPKGEANDLWKRFRAARTTIEQNRKAFFAELDSAHKDVRTRKQNLIEQAEALADKGADGVSAYRNLLEEWKKAGRSGKKQDDAMWAKFKAAGDVLYSAKSEVEAIDNEEYDANLVVKLELVSEAEALLTVTDRVKARDALSTIQRKWDAIGKVPRDQVKPIEDRLRKVEAVVRKLDEDHWKRNNPETKARTEGLAGQLNDAIAKLEAELEAAHAGKDTAAITEATEALEARKAWLKAIGQ